MTRAVALAAALGVALVLAGCGNQMIVRAFEDAETGLDVTCTGSDWGGNGVPHGYWICTWPSGSKHSTGRYLEGEKVGEWKYYDRHGKLSHTEIWHDGEPVVSQFGDEDAGVDGLSSSFSDIDAQ